MPEDHGKRTAEYSRKSQRMVPADVDTLGGQKELSLSDVGCLNSIGKRRATE